MVNRYVITFLHWITSVLSSACLTVMAVGGKNEITGIGQYQEVFSLALVFGGVFGFPFLIISFFIIPIILRRMIDIRSRTFVLSFYTFICCLLGFVLLRVSGIWNDSDDEFGNAFFIPVFVAVVIGSLSSAIFWANQYRPTHVPKRSLPDVLDQI